MQVLITGASGYIGRNLTRDLLSRGITPTGTSRTRPSDCSIDFIKHDLAAPPIDASAFDLFVHCAGHITGEADEASARIGENIGKSGARKIIFISSIAASPTDVSSPYAENKREAERAFLDALDNSTKAVILRPPAIYGRGSRGPLDKLKRLIARDLPLPLALARTARPYIAIDNLTDLIATISNAADDLWEMNDRQIIEPHDGTLVATNDLCRALGSAVGKPARLFPVPASALRTAGKVVGAEALVSSALDPVPVRYGYSEWEKWGWSPIVSMPESFTL